MIGKKERELEVLCIGQGERERWAIFQWVADGTMKNGMIQMRQKHWDLYMSPDVEIH